MVLSKRSAIVALQSSLAVGLASAWSAHASLAAGVAAASKPQATTVTVALEQPSEYSINLSTTQVPIGTVAFTVTNHGTLPHDFKICAQASGPTTPTECAGKSTSTLNPGQSTVLEVLFEHGGSFEYLSTVPGHAKAGTGLLDVGQNAHGAQKLALAQRVAQCMHARGFPEYPDNGNFTASGSKPSAPRANAAEQNCENQARKALGLP